MAKAQTTIDNPLAVAKEILKEFEIPEESVSPLRMAGYLQAQREELETMLVRSLFDCVHARRLMESDIEALRVKGGNNLVDHKNQVQQFYGGVRMVDRLLEQLRKEYKEQIGRAHV